MSDELLWLRENIWYAVFRYSDENGKRKRVFRSTGFKKNQKKQALKRARSWYKEAEMQGYIDEFRPKQVVNESSPLVTDYARFWFQVNKSMWKHSTTLGYESALRLHVIPQLGTFRLAEIKPLHIQQFVAAKVEAGYNPKTINNLLAPLSSMLTDAEDNIDGFRSPVRKKHWQKIPKRKARIYTWNQVTELFRSCRKHEPEIFPFVVLLFTSGLRFGEATALQWADIDFIENEIYIERAQYRQVEGLPKHDKTRTVPLHPFAKKVLLEHRQLRHLQNGLVFPPIKKGKKFLTEQELRYPYRRAQRHAGLPELNFHEARHSFASALVNAGQSPYLVKEILGHESMSMTESYSHSVRSALISTVQVLAVEDEEE